MKTCEEHTECAQVVIDYDAAAASGNVTEMIAVDEKVWKPSCLSHFGKAQLTVVESTRIQYFHRLIQRDF